MDAVKITFDNGQIMVTDYNSQVSREEIAKYYVGNWFNLGSVSDDMHKCIKVEFDVLDWPRYFEQRKIK